MDLPVQQAASTTDAAPIGQSRRTLWLAVGVLAVLSLAMFSPSLLSGEDKVPMGGDMLNLGRFLTDFCFSQIRQGHLPLWNPHIFSGMPCLGNPNATMLYPGSWLCLFLPMAKAITLYTVLHVFLVGLFMYLWTSRQGLHPLACLFSAVTLTYCGAYFSRINAGHASPIAAMTWTPLVFLVIDELFLRPGSLRWMLVGVAAWTMIILGGHPQYGFFTCLAVGLYTVARLIRSQRRGRIVLALAAIVLAAMALSALHILSVVEASSEGSRGQTPSYAFISTFSFPWTGFVMFLAPGFFGGLREWPGSVNVAFFWNDWFFWEMTPFIGIAALALAAYGAIFSRRNRRWLALCLCLAFLVLALGRHTPILKLLYDWLPPFDRFRCSARSLFYVSLFALLLAAMGLDALIREGRFSRAVFGVLLAIVAVLVGTGVWALASSWTAQPDSSWQQFMAWTCDTKGFAYPAQMWTDPVVGRFAARYAAVGAFLAAGTAAAVAMMLFRAVKSSRWAWAVAVLGMAEVLCFAHLAGETFYLDSNPGLTKDLRAFYQRLGEDSRVCHNTLNRINSAMSLGGYDIWGYDPLVPKRYSEYMNFTQEAGAEAANVFYMLRQGHPSFAMLRLKYVMDYGADGKVNVTEMPEPMPRLALMNDYRVLADRNEVFTMLSSPTWNMRRTVILESQPNPAPVATELTGSARIVESSTDYMIVEADLPASAILLVTDSYSKFWRVVSLGSSPQQSYQVLPANYVLRAVPLTAGHHRFRLEYAPPMVSVGKWISIVSLLAYLSLAAWTLIARKGFAAG